MKSFSIPYHSDKNKTDYSLIDLFNRVIKGQRARWDDIYSGPGVYVIYLEKNSQPRFMNQPKYANLTNQTNRNNLIQKWQSINSKIETDIIYIGKGKSLKERIRALIRFGHGKKNRHYGGEWLWLIENIDDLRIIISSCPFGKERGYESGLLNKFLNDHHELPLCNRKRGDNVPIWMPEN